MHILLALDKSFLISTIELNLSNYTPSKSTLFPKNCFETNPSHAYNCTHVALIHTCTQSHSNVCAVEFL